MAAKLLHSLADDNPDLQKQIGCMTGIFQIFDRQQFLSGRRPNPRRLLPPPTGNTKFGDGNLDADSSNTYNREAVERNPNKYINERQRQSAESSRGSFSSSSRSSSFSSLDCGRTGQPDPSSMDRIIFPETPSRDPVISQTSASPKMGRLSVDLRDVVKDSMYRDSRGLSVQTTSKDEGLGHTFKHKDSPRPMQLSKSVDGSVGAGMKGNQDVPADIKESLRVLAKLRDAPWYYNEKELPSLSYESLSRDAPRFSYDGRDMNRKIKDLPRRSLDSKESSGRSSMIEFDNEKPANLLQPSRPSSVVAKLMGLDMLPETKPSHETQLGAIKTFLKEDRGPSLRVPDGCRPVRLPKSPRSSRKEPTSPRWKNHDAVMRPVSSSKIAIEPAPWKHLDNGRASPKQASRQVKSSSTTSSSSPSVYGEIEKRLKDIEFKQSGKDLRALKQILEAMQAKGFLENTKEEQTSNLVNKRDEDLRFGSDSNGRTMNFNDSRTNRPVSPKLRGSSKASESPIVIMKPAKLVQKSGIPASSIIPIGGEFAAQRNNSASSRTAKDQRVKDGQRDQATSSMDRKTNNRNLRVAQTSSSRGPQIAKDNTTTTNSSKNSGSISPRLQQKKLEFDKRSRPPTPPSDSSKPRRQPNRQSSESSSPGGRRRPKTSSVQQIDDQLSEKSNESRNLSCPEDNTSMQSETNLTLEPVMDVEITSAEQSVETARFQSPSKEAHCFPGEMENDVNLRLSEVDTVGDLVVAIEQPSPISVLDSSAYMEDSPSPVKQTSHTHQGDAVTESNDDSREEEHWKRVELPSEISRKKLQNINNLVQKLQRLNSTHDEAQTDYIASLCDNTNTNPDHRYISEILLASGLLLRDLTTFQLHPSGHPINPELFFVLEQTKSSCLISKPKPKPEKLHRKLIFDAVNELLAQKLNGLGPRSEPWPRPDKLARKTLSAQKLLKELCAEIELLQSIKNENFILLEEEEDSLKAILWEDVMNRSDNWTDFRGEVSGIVLDVERSIFKELVDEIVIGEAAGLIRGKPNRRCRQLFSK